MAEEKISKIYSRRRFVILAYKNRKKNNNSSYSGGDNTGRHNTGGHDSGRYNTGGDDSGRSAIGRHKKRKIVKLIIVLVGIIIIFRFIFYYFEPVFKTLCEEKVKSVATIITNQQSTLIMNKYQYNQLYTLEKDGNGNVMIVKANVVPINNLISDLTENIQHEFDNIGKTDIAITLGNLSGIYFISGFGPEIPITISITGNVETDIKSEFIAQGINQSLHRVYVNFDCDMKIVTPLKNYTQKVTNQVIIAEHVIVGNIPESYYNLEGLNSNSDMLQLIK